MDTLVLFKYIWVTFAVNGGYMYLYDMMVYMYYVL